VLTRYSDVLAALHDNRLSEERITPFLDRLSPKERTQMAPLSQALSRMMLFVDPPDHTRLRGLVNKAFTPRVVERLRPYIQHVVGDLLGRVEAAGRMDVIRDLAAPLSAAVIAEMLSIPREDRARFEEWISLLHAFFSRSTREVDNVIALRDYFDRVLAQRRKDLGDDLLSALITAREHHDMFTDDELFSTFLLLFDAGQVTTTNLIGNGMLALLRHPDQLAQLRDNPALSTTAVAELLRYDGPVQFTGRIATDDLTIDDKLIRKGENVTLVLAAANRDPAQFPEPDRLDISRQVNRHLAFGHGIHFCLGASLALLEAQTALNAFLQRLSSIRLAQTNLEWHESINFRFLKSLPVTFNAG
jgi:pimeloyl-[acyl-carrier protein] synthase